ncbi:serine/threonine-protein kinase 31 isoform X5 [Gorilla gorilla gorilla]|uniref:serine/threonine-protein kinase 31 isoform X5 n=1 Tax=Gorilla gorilla gorilla TaxID=9595 RepID=UPI002446153F|nr:serine/threonine-protein kinase 31 isoform X9 [Gorilla gorilla gorilla]
MMAQRCARRRSVGPLRSKLTRFSGIVQMDEDTHYDKVEDVVGSHIEDAVTFWAQSINRNKDIMKIGCSLSEVCPQASSVLGNLDPNKIYGGLFSEDQCWYRCKVLKIISVEKCLVRYIDYGNTEILNRSDIVEIPLELQFSSVAKKYKLWGLHIPSDQEVTQFDQQEKAAAVDLTNHLESTLKTCIDTRMKNLAAKMEILKEMRHVDISVRFGKDLSDAIQVLDEGCFTTPASLNGLEIIWAEYSLAQEKIKTCEYVNEGNILIAQRNEMQQKLYMSVEDFIVEVDESSLNKRLKTLQDLSVSLEAVYGQAKEGANSDEILKKFYDWKCDKREEFTNVRSETDASLHRLVAWFQRTLKVFDLSMEESLISEYAMDNIDEILEKTESSVCKELEIALVDQGDADKEIISNAYSQVLQKIHSEERLIATVQAKYKDSIEFKKQLIEYLNKSPSVDHLLSIKKTLKSLKARLRWKLVEKNNLEESDDPDGSQIEKIKEEITQLRNNVFQEIYHEREEYEMLTSLAQKWFPELPLLHPEIGLLKYMNSGGLLTMSLERDLLDAEPMKELSSKRPLVRSEVNGQIILLKGYSVDVDTEAKVIERAATYHRAWREAEEDSGLLPLIFLFLCKSDPMAYLMVPYYPRANLNAVQANMPLNSEEALKVMKGVAQGLHTLHKADIIHGSLHQNNVFALNREQGIVGDFDFTKSVSQRASVNMMVGDLSLMSPELKMGKPASPGSDLYAYGCLLLWLSVQNQEFEINKDGIPKMDQFHLDDKVKSLLCSLIYYRSSMTAEQVLNAECFLMPKEKSVPNPEKDTEYTLYKKEEEIKTENLDKCMEKTRNGEAKFDC